MSKILITGGAGHIGSELAQRFVIRGEDVTVFDNLSTGLKTNLRSPYTVRLITGDVNNYRDISAVMLSNEFDYVYHYAAVVGVQRTLADPIAVLRDIDGIRNILDLCKNTGVRRVFFSSSSEVYGESHEFPQKEDTTPINSRLPYAVVKNVGETMIKAYYERYGLNYTIFRFFNTYGGRQTTDFVIPKFIKLAKEGKPITIYGDGSQTRTYLHIDDNLMVTTSPIYRFEPFKNETINVGSDIEISINELVNIISDVMGKPIQRVYVPVLKEGDMMRRRPDITAIRNELGDFPAIDIRTGIKMLLDDRS